MTTGTPPSGDLPSPHCQGHEGADVRGALGEGTKGRALGGVRQPSDPGVAGGCGEASPTHGTSQTGGRSSAGQKAIRGTLDTVSR